VKLEKIIGFAIGGVTLIGLGASLPATATAFNGNGNNGFGGAIGLGSLTLSNDGSRVSGTLTRGTGTFNNALVIYIDSVNGGFASTSGFSDNADGLRRAISGFNNASQRSTMTFDTNFRPDFAIALGPVSDNFGGLWSLATGGGNSLGFLTSVNLTPSGSGTATNYSFSFNLATIGLTPGIGQSFKLFGTYISNTAFRSTEALAGNVTGTQGYNAFTQNGFGSYLTLTVPEPSSMVALLSLAAIGGGAFVKCRIGKP
jgi:hypothetical protein